MADRFVLDGEPLLLDLLNTRVREGDEYRELLAGPQDLQSWVERHPDELPDAAHYSAVEEVIALREAARSVLSALVHGTAVPDEALAALNTHAAAQPAIAVLQAGPPGLRKVVRRPGPAEQQLLSALADAAITFLASPAASTVRQCQAPGCVLLFLPTHPARRWCSPSTCGNRVRVARHYQQRKTRTAKPIVDGDGRTTASKDGRRSR